ncbi:6,7-dimethyl-8-ribityllumazine synthase [Corynebacterium bovis]|uniref:6,7-dimethyl-8-ribityllumazine synthase n=1 Tax=Corynebacterium bovis TaxID=36808 RepID=UPI00244968DE|nr:6,7-dimethyl-8-ribityllumazine synthase [Corynebacterium bovis]MDH2455006.1 6,7-dimethyl-8-ribityllumazine synthase [Corynebacterium bovis]
MSGTGVSEITVRPGAAEGLTVAVVSSTWNAEITDQLHSRAVETLREAGALVTEYRVAGALELPVIVAALLEVSDAVVATGCVIRGATVHFDHVCNSVTYGLTRCGLDAGRPVGNGVLTVDDVAQARDRAGLPGAAEDKGHDAAVAALHSALVLREIRGSGR